jgi:hypothetical protein
MINVIIENPNENKVKASELEPGDVVISGGELCLILGTEDFGINPNDAYNVPFVHLRSGHTDFFHEDGYFEPIEDVKIVAHRK